MVASEATKVTIFEDIYPKLVRLNGFNTCPSLLNPSASEQNAITAEKFG